MGKYLNLVCMTIVWAFFLASQGYVNQTFSSYTTGVFMFGIAAVLLLATLVITKRCKKLLEVKAVWVYLILVGVIGFLSNMCAFYGYKYGDAQTGTFLLKIDVFLVCLGSALIYKIKFDKRDILCGLTMFAGVLLVLDIDFATMSFRTTDILFLGAAFFIAMNSFLVAQMMKKANHQIDSHAIAFYNALVSLTLFAFMMVTSGDVASIASGLARMDILVALIVLGLGQYVIFLTYYRALTEFPVWLVKVVLLLVPILTMGLNYIIYGTIPSAIAIMGGMVVLASGYGVLRNQEKKKREEISEETSK